MANRRRFLELIGTAGGWIASSTLARAQFNVKVEDSIIPPTTDTRENTLRIALMQAMPAGNNQKLNLEKAEDYCRQAAAQDADLLLMPEMWNIGYQAFYKFDPETIRQWQAQAICVDGTWVNRFRHLARELKMAIAVTYLQKWLGKPRNAVSLIDRHGNIVLTYAKVHTCDFGFEAALTPGESWPAVELETAWGAVRVGAMICFDREFPESMRSLMLQGAEVVLTPNACLLDPIRIAQFKVRAYENATAVAIANYPKPLHNGQSIAFDPTGKPLLDAQENEGLYVVPLDLDALRAYRQATIWGNSWRKPHRYGALTDQVDLAVFRRKNAYGQPFDPLQR